MFARPVQVYTPQCARGMATLKDIKIRLKSVTNIQKITKSMKMVSAAKFARAERELRPARPYGDGARAFFDRLEVQQDMTQPNHLIVAVTSDRGLCGACHTNIVKTIRARLNEEKPGTETKIVCIGDKSRGMLQRTAPKKILMHFADVGKKPPVFKDAGTIADHIIASGFKFDVGSLYYNRFKSVVSYQTLEMPLFSQEKVAGSEKLNLYDSIDDDVLQSYNEFALASLLYYTMKEGATSEQSSRMTAMDSASKNAGEMIDKLTLTYNRTRQAVITKELIEIISGAAAI